MKFWFHYPIHLNNLEVWAKVIKFVSFLTSGIKMLNRKRLKTEPCGTDYKTLEWCIAHYSVPFGYEKLTMCLSTLLYLHLTYVATSNLCLCVCVCVCVCVHDDVRKGFAKWLDEALFFKFWDNFMVKHDALCLLQLWVGGSRG